MAATKLPGWVKDDAQSIRDEMAPYVDATPEELWTLTAACARDAMWALSACDVPEAALAYREPLPARSVEILARLRRS
jgi:hypothetical protein